MEFVKTQEFREKATQEDVQKLLDYYLKAKSKEWTEETCPYGFSRTSATTLLKEKGLLGGLKEEPEALDIKFSKLETKPHSLYLTDEVWERLECIYKGYESVNKQNVLDAFLRKALDDMGV